VISTSRRNVATSSNHDQELGRTTPVAVDIEATEMPSNGHHSEPTGGSTLLEAEGETAVDSAEPEERPGMPLSRFSAFVLPDDGEGVDEEMLLTTCPARQPRETDLFRVRPNDGEAVWRMKTLMVDYRWEDPAVPRGFYLIHPRLARVFSGLGKPYLLLTCVTNHGSMFIWPIRLVEGFGDSWCKSRLRIAAMAETQWVRVLGSQGNGYAAVVSRKDHGEPRWQGANLDELLAIAFDGRIVEELTHPLCQTFELS
jgi:hypothetical protein